MSSPLSVTLSGRHVTLTPLDIDDVAGLVAAASGDRSTFGWSIVPDNVGDMDGRRPSTPGRCRSANRGAVRDATQRQRSRVIGMTRFLTLRWFFDRDYPDGAEIGGTFLTATAQRTAANTEAKLLMMTHAFDVWGVRRLDLKTDERNDRSRRAIERIGAQFEGVLAQLAGSPG
jgi:hypothetical protein